MGCRAQNRPKNVGKVVWLILPYFAGLARGTLAKDIYTFLDSPFVTKEFHMVLGNATPMIREGWSSAVPNLSRLLLKCCGRPNGVVVGKPITMLAFCRSSMFVFVHSRCVQWVS